MASDQRGRLSSPHDWHSSQYVADWIVHDTARDPERRPRLRAMLEAAPFRRDVALAVLDVGAGYGAVSEKVLQVFPGARVTLQDYSTPMLDQARTRLAAHSSQLRIVTCDLTDPSWPGMVGGPFDLAVSAICLHNLQDNAKIFACYRAIFGLLRPGGCFLDYDLFFDGADKHIAALRDGGFARVDMIWQEPPRATLVASR